MILVRPITVTPAMLVASNIDENDAPVWSAGTTYAEAQEVLFQHRVYESLIDGNLNIPPDTGALADPPKWLDLGPANCYRMFDASPSTTSQRAGTIQHTIAPGRDVNVVGLVNLTAQSVTVERLSAGGAVVWAQTRSLLDADALGNGEADYLTDVVFLGLPLTADRLRITITAAAGTAKCGGCLIGRQSVLGDTLFGTVVGIRDYSRKETDEFGVTTIVKRGYAKTADFSLVLDTARLSAVQRQLAAVRAEPALFVGISNRDVSIVYGFYRGFQLVIAGPVRSTASIEVESLTYEGDDALFPAATVTTPALTSPAAGSTVSQTATLASSAFATSPANVDSHASSDWQVASNAGFSAIVHQSLDDTVNKTAYTIPAGALAASSTYYARVRHRASALGVSQWSAGVQFNTVAPSGSVNAPSITTPAANGVAHNQAAPFGSSAFSTTGSADTHQASDWQLATDAGFANVIDQTLGDTANKTGWTSLAPLTAGATYYLRVRHRGTTFGYSAWSATRTLFAADPWSGLGNSYDIATGRVGPCSASLSVTFTAQGSWQVGLTANGNQTTRLKNGATFTGTSDAGTWASGAINGADYQIRITVTQGAGGSGVGAGTGGYVSLPRTFSVDANSNAAEFAEAQIEVRIRQVSAPANEIVKTMRLSASASNQN